MLLDPWTWASLIVVAGGVLLWPGRPDDDPEPDPDPDPEPEPA